MHNSPVGEELVHDFGLVLPDQKLAHDFTIVNPTDRDWHLIKAVQSCTCSVATGTSRTIRAGGSETFRFDYHTPAGTADERRWVTLEFDDRPGHEVKLVATAWVRPPMTPRITALSCGSVALGAASEQVVELGNFTAEDWPQVELVSPPAWLSLDRASRADLNWAGARPRETWVVGLRIATAGLKPDAYRAEARFRTSTGATAKVMVEFVAGMPVQVKPSLVMLGRADPGQPAEAATTLRFAGAAPPCSPDRITVSAEGIKLLDSKVEPANPLTWRLTARLEPAGNPGDFIVGKLIVGFPGDDPPAVIIPVHAQIRPRP